VPFSDLLGGWRLLKGGARDGHGIKVLCGFPQQSGGDVALCLGRTCGTVTSEEICPEEHQCNYELAEARS